MQVLIYSSDFDLEDYSSSRLRVALSATAAAAVILCLSSHVLGIWHCYFLNICHYDKNIVIKEDE
jgi:hypothetical protein